MKDRMTLLIAVLAIALTIAACDGTATTTPTPTAQPAMAAETEAPAVQPATEPSPTEAPANEESVASACEEFFGFCVTAEIDGSVISTGTGGFGSSFNNDCAAWAAGGETRILELPTTLAAGDDKITVALTRIGAYTGPGQYELAAVAASGNPDSFPAIEVAGRTFSKGEGSTTLVTVAADGSGSLQATGLVELASMTVSSPDPDARIDFSMQWTCQEEK